MRTSWPRPRAAEALSSEKPAEERFTFLRPTQREMALAGGIPLEELFALDGFIFHPPLVLSFRDAAGWWGSRLPGSEAAREAREAILEVSREVSLAPGVTTKNFAWFLGQRDELAAHLGTLGGALSPADPGAAREAHSELAAALRTAYDESSMRVQEHFERVYWGVSLVVPPGREAYGAAMKTVTPLSRFRDDAVAAASLPAAATYLQLCEELVAPRLSLLGEKFDALKPLLREVETASVRLQGYLMQAEALP